MNTHRNKQIALYGGAFLGAVVALVNFVQAIRISLGESITKVLIPELFSALLVTIIFLFPACVLYIKRETLTPKIWKISVAYPFFVLLGLLNIIFIKVSWLAGLPIMVVVVPFCIIFGLVVLFKK